MSAQLRLLAWHVCVGFCVDEITRVRACVHIIRMRAMRDG